MRIGHPAGEGRGFLMTAFGGPGFVVTRLVTWRRLLFLDSSAGCDFREVWRFDELTGKVFRVRICSALATGGEGRLGRSIVACPCMASVERWFFLLFLRVSRRCAPFASFALIAPADGDAD